MADHLSWPSVGSFTIDAIDSKRIVIEDYQLDGYRKIKKAVPEKAHNIDLRIM